jgi:signal transduction histidine kinase
LKFEATDFITKPINHDILDMAVNRAWEKIEMRRQIRDHTDNLHRLVQEELRATRHKFHQLFEAAPCYITVQDHDLRITESNRLFKSHFGDGGGLSCYGTYKHRKEPCADCPVLMTFEDGLSHRSETVVTAKDGRQYNVLITTAPLRDADGRITHVMEMSIDITQIRQLQDQLTSLGLLISSVSHGVKGLLTGMDGGIYMLRSGLRKEDTALIEEGMDIVRQMGIRLRKQVLDILYYAKARELHTQQVEVLSFAESVANTVSPKAESAGVHFVRMFDPDPGLMEIDPDVVTAALVNILENAVDACSENADKDPHQVLFTVKGEPASVLFEVQDDGIGMDREVREKMFTLFFSSKGNKGTGLGLFIAHKMVDQHGGTISVESEPGKGSRFRIRLPRVQPETPR